MDDPCASTTVLINMDEFEFKVFIDVRAYVHNRSILLRVSFPRDGPRRFPVKEGMLGPYQILLPLLSLFLVRVDLTDMFPLALRVEIVTVLDGDTVDVLEGKRVLRIRLNKIDAAEKKQTFLSSPGSAGAVSLACMKRLLTKKFYTLRIEKQDMYGRLLGDIDELNFGLIQAGCAGLYPHAQFTSQKEKFDYLRALKEAKRRRLGVWNFGGYQTPKIWRKLSRRGADRPSHRRRHSLKPYRLARRSE
jgi:micrococcal nuclease